MFHKQLPCGTSCTAEICFKKPREFMQRGQSQHLHFVVSYTQAPHRAQKPQKPKMPEVEGDDLGLKITYTVHGGQRKPFDQILMPEALLLEKLSHFIT